MTYRELKAALETIDEEQLDRNATAYMAQGPNASMFTIQQFRRCDEALIAECPSNALLLVEVGYPLLVGNRDRRPRTSQN
jgi:hypothetical protein